MRERSGGSSAPKYQIFRIPEVPRCLTVTPTFVPGPIIPGPYLSPQQTENSPLKHSILGSTKQSIENWLWGWDFSLDGAGSLKSVVVLLFGTAGVVTLALLTQIYKGETQLVRHGAVASDHPDCTQIGVDMLERGGHAVDAAIAAAMCLGVVHFHDTGLGG